MSYIGQPPVFGNLSKQTLTANGTTTVFTLDFNIVNAQSLLVMNGNVLQEPGVAYNHTAANQITFGTAPINLSSLYVIFLGKELILPSVADGAITATKMNSNFLASLNSVGRNKIINGDFIVARRGTTFDSTTAPLNSDDTYLLDRWLLLSDGNDVVDVSQGTDGSVGNYSYLRADVETVSLKFGFLQIIEQKNLRELFDGLGKVSLGFNAKVSDATKLSRIKAAVISWDSTADTVTSDIISAWGAEGVNPTLATNWTYENTPVDLGVTATDTRFTIEDIDIDTASMANVAVFIWSDDVATNDTLGTTLDITNVQLETGTIATEYEHRSIGQELDLCRRYYERISETDENLGSGITFLTTLGIAVWPFKTLKRAAPTMDSSDSAALKVSTTTDFVSTAVGFSFPLPNSVRVDATTSGMTQGQGCLIRLNGASKWVDADAEL